jgi:hypothetical protein
VSGRGAAGVFGVQLGRVADVDVSQPGGSADGCGFAKGRDRRGRDVEHAMSGEEPADVPRRLGAQRLDDPPGDLRQRGAIVVDAGDDECRHLEPDARVAHGHEAVEDRLEGGAADPPVELVVEALEVDVRRVDDAGKELHRLRGRVAVRDVEAEEAGVAGESAGVHDVLDEDRRLDVRVGDRGGAGMKGLGHGGGGREPAGLEVEPEPRRLRDLPVLAEVAVEVAADRRDGVGERGRRHVEERLLLDGIDVDGYGPGMDEADQLAVAVLAHPADAESVWPQQTAVGTGIAADAAIRLRLGEQGGDGGLALGHDGGEDGRRHAGLQRDGSSRVSVGHPVRPRAERNGCGAPLGTGRSPARWDPSIECRPETGARPTPARGRPRGRLVECSSLRDGALGRGVAQLGSAHRSGR